LANAILNDGSVARHYAGFREAGARVMVLKQNDQDYVSYRIGDGIFWTKKPITLHKGESVIIEGDIEARMRCGNRVSATPQLPVSSQEPAPEVLATVQSPLFPDESNSFVNLLPALGMAKIMPIPPASDTAVATTDNQTTGPSSISATLSELNYSLPIPVDLVSTSTALGTPAIPIATPETGTGLFLLLALLGLVCLGKPLAPLVVRGVTNFPQL
jgi:hypothetical protein